MQTQFQTTSKVQGGHFTPEWTGQKTLEHANQFMSVSSGLIKEQNFNALNTLDVV